MDGPMNPWAPWGRGEHEPMGPSSQGRAPLAHGPSWVCVDLRTYENANANQNEYADSNQNENANANEMRMKMNNRYEVVGSHLQSIAPIIVALFI